jgi:hypothetical protein
MHFSHQALSHVGHHWSGLGKIFEFWTYPSSVQFAHDLAYYWSYEEDFGFVGFVSSF